MNQWWCMCIITFMFHYWSSLSQPRHSWVVDASKRMCIFGASVTSENISWANRDDMVRFVAFDHHKSSSSSALSNIWCVYTSGVCLFGIKSRYRSYWLTQAHTHTHSISQMEWIWFDCVWIAPNSQSFRFRDSASVCECGGRININIANSSACLFCVASA